MPQSEQERPLVLTWPQVEELCDQIAEFLRPGAERLGFPFEAIYAVPRGGLAIAGILSYKLNVPKVFTTVGLDEAHANAYRRYLVIEDIVESGKTISRLRKRFRRGNIITLVQRGDVGTSVDLVAKRVPHWQPVIFPWAPNDLTKAGGTLI